MNIKCVWTLIFQFAAVCCWAADGKKLKFHQLFTDNAVFQQNINEYPFRGSAPAGSQVKIQFRGKEAVATANEQGEWEVFLPSGKAGTGFELKASCGDQTITAQNIAVGEVWVVSGQSNAEFPLKNFKDGAEWAKDAAYPLIRFQTQTWQPPHMRKDDPWQILDGNTAVNFSAAGFFFAKELYKKQQIPVGVIVAAGSGSVINKWVPEEALAELPLAQERLIKPLQKAREKYQVDLKKYEDELEQRKKLSKEEVEKLPKLQKPYYPFQSYSGLFKERVERLAGLPVKGLIWYQGEADAMFAGGFVYREYLEALIKSYRKHFKNDNLPFLVVEIPYYGNHGIWSDLRDSQKFVADKLKNVHLVSILDIGDEKDIHPPRKAELGARLMKTADCFVYGNKAVATGPIYDSMSIEGNSIILRFKPESIGEGICSSDGEPLRGFTVADKKGKFFEANAVIKDNTVIVSSPRVAEPTAVRYGWYTPQNGVNFFNKAGFPSGMFRTDNFRLPTQP